MNNVLSASANQVLGRFAIPTILYASLHIQVHLGRGKIIVYGRQQEPQQQDSFYLSDAVLVYTIWLDSTRQIIIKLRINLYAFLRAMTSSMD